MTYVPQPLPSSGDDGQSLPRASNQRSLRASDLDRETAANALRDHCAQGRLSPDELSDRLDLLYASKTTEELRTLFDDLPTPPAGVAGPRRILRLPGRLVAIPAVTAVVALAAVTDAHLLWLAWPVLAIAGRHHRFRSRRSITTG